MKPGRFSAEEIYVNANAWDGEGVYIGGGGAVQACMETELMRIRYVVSTMVFWWREHYLSFEQECEFLKSLGFGVELWPTIKGDGDCRYTRRNWPRLKEATKDMLVSLNSRNDGPTLAEWTEQIECAKMLNACIVANLRGLCISQDLGIADWDYLLNGLGKDDNDVIGSLEMFPCMPGTMIRQSSKFLFDVIGWPDRPQLEPDHTEKHYRPL